MNPRLWLNRKIHAELDDLVRRGVLDAGSVTELKARYPVTAWDFMALVRIFTVMGVLSAFTGFLVLARAHMNWWLFSEGALAVISAGCFYPGHLMRRKRSMPLTGEALELAGAMALQGFTIVLAAHHSTGSENWPALIGLDTGLLLAVAYLLANRLVLWLACANFFFYFGAQTGYLSGWGCYWLGMTYPVRFLAAGILTLCLSWWHAFRVRGRWSGFSRVYAHFGLLVSNLSLWFLSLFGYFEEHASVWEDKGGERFLFSLLWAAVSAVSVFAGSRYGLKLARGYGMTFLVINVYTFYFQFIVANTGEAWFIHMLMTGASLLWLGRKLELRSRFQSGDE